MRTSLCLCLGLFLLPSCQDRDAAWDQGVDRPVTAVQTSGALLLFDAPEQRALAIAVESDLSLSTVSIAVGRSLATVAPTPDQTKVLVLTRGDVPRRSANDQGPSLAVIAGGTAPSSAGAYPLSDPLSGLTLDPESRFAIVHATSADSAFVENPNELIVVDLTKPPSATNPVPFTLRSFGGQPDRIDFTQTLDLPGGPKRLLVVETDRDLALIDLDDLSAPDVTVRLTESTQKQTPVGFAVSDGEAGRNDDARIAVRLDGDPNVVILDLLPPAPGDPPNVTFRPTPNIVAVGGPATDIAFVRTDGGLRLAALVPSVHALVLVDPETGVTSSVDLPDGYQNMALVTDAVGGTGSGSDVALLWSAYSASIAFVALGSTVGKPYKSVEVLPLSAAVSTVLDVPSPHSVLKVLVSADGTSFFVLDLAARTASPLLASERGVSVTLSPDGARAWALVPGSANLAAIDMQKLHPQNLLLTQPIQQVFDVGRRDGGRALLALHSIGAIGITVLDGRAPSLLDTREYGAVLTGGLP